MKKPLELTDPRSLKYGDLPAGTRIGEVKPVFPKLKREEILAAITSEAKKKLDK